MNFQMLMILKQFFWPATPFFDSVMKDWLLDRSGSLTFLKPRKIDLSPSQIDGGAFFVKPPLIALFFLFKSSYKVKRFFTNSSLSNNYPHHSIFPLNHSLRQQVFSSPIPLDYPFQSSLSRRFFSSTISLLLPYLPYRARRFFALINLLVFLPFFPSG